MIEKRFYGQGQGLPLEVLSGLATACAPGTVHLKAACAYATLSGSAALVERLSEQASWPDSTKCWLIGMATAEPTRARLNC